MGLSGAEWDELARRQRSASAKLGWHRRRAAGFKCKPRPARVRERELALARAYRVQQVNRAELFRRFEHHQQARGVFVSERGFETLWRLYVSTCRLYRVKGQATCTTNGQRSKAMEKAGRPRCGRTVQRQYRMLEQLRVVRVEHVKRMRATPGKRDCLRVHLLQSFVIPRSAAEAAEGYASASAKQNRHLSSGVTAPIAPPAGGRERKPPDGAAKGSDKVNGDRNGVSASPDVASIDSVRELLDSPSARAEVLRRLRAQRRGPGGDSS